MTFAIDTGIKERSIVDLIPGWFRDMFDADAAPERLAHDYGLHLSSAIRNPKTLDTSRKHLVAQWSFLRDLAEVHPAIFDEVLVAYAEITQGGAQ